MSNSRSFRRRMTRLRDIPGWERSMMTRWVIRQRRRGRYTALKKAAESRSNSSNG